MNLAVVDLEAFPDRELIAAFLASSPGHTQPDNAHAFVDPDHSRHDVAESLEDCAEKLRDALAATDMDTFYGHIKFSAAGNNIAKPMVLRQIQDGKYVVVAPTKYASEPVVYPRKAPM